MNSWLHHHIVIVALVVHSLAVTGMKVDVEHLPWLASHLDPQLPHFIPTLSPRQLGSTQH